MLAIGATDSTQRPSGGQLKDNLDARFGSTRSYPRKSVAPLAEWDETPWGGPGREGFDETDGGIWGVGGLGAGRQVPQMKRSLHVEDGGEASAAVRGVCGAKTR